MKRVIHEDGMYRSEVLSLTKFEDFRSPEYLALKAEHIRLRGDVNANLDYTRRSAEAERAAVLAKPS